MLSWWLGMISHAYCSAAALYRRFTRRADRRLPPGCYGNLIVNVTRGQSRPNVPVGSTPTDTIGPRSRARLSPRSVLVVLKWRKNRSIFKARRVFSFDILHWVTHFFASQPTSTIVRRLRMNPTTHDYRGRALGPSKICPSCEWPITS